MYLPILTTLYGNKDQYFAPQGILSTPLILSLDPKMLQGDLNIKVKLNL